MSLATSIWTHVDQILSEAVQKKDAALCDRLKNRHDIDRCLAEVGKVKQDVSLCTRVVNAAIKDPCLLEIAATRADASFCKQVTTDPSTTSCRAMLARSADICKSLNSHYAPECIQSVAIFQRDASVCRAEKNGTRVRDCQQRVAVLMGDPEICFEARDAYCFKKVFAIMPSGKLKSSVCDRRSPETEWAEVGRKACRAELALATNSTAQCPNGVDGKPDELCVSNIATGSKNPALCKDIRNLKLRSECYSYIGSTTLDSSLCRQASAGKSQDRCFQQVATGRADPNICASVQEAQAKDYCLTWAGEKGKDPNPCMQIKMRIGRTQCLRGVARNSGRTDLCDAHKDPSERDICAFHLSVDITSPALCETIKSADIAYYCRAFHKVDRTQCEKIRNVAQRQECMHNVATLRQTCASPDCGGLGIQVRKLKFKSLEDE